MAALVVFHPSCQLARVARIERVPRVAAVAIRDHVSDFEKWGSKRFTVEFLKAGYERHWYLTENQRSDEVVRGQFKRALRDALEAYDAVDIFLLAHANRYIDLVEQLDPKTRRRIRLVYNTGCGDAAQSQQWLELGARAYVAHPGNDLAPIFYYYFLPAWTAGVPLAEAVKSANAETKSEIEDGAASWVIGLLQGRTAEDYWKATEAKVFGAPNVVIFSLESPERLTHDPPNERGVAQSG